VCVVSNVGWKTTRVLTRPGTSSSPSTSSAAGVSSSSPNELSATRAPRPATDERVVVSNSRERCHSGRRLSQSISQSYG
jgi:hypothetical protein